MDDFEKLINASDLIEWIMETYPDWCVGDVRSIVDHVMDLPSAQPEITDEQAIEHLQSTGWMQNHDREMYESGLRKQLADDSGSYDSLIPCGDTISRQAAIDAMCDACSDWCDEGICKKVSAIQRLPSAQPYLYEYDVEHLRLIARVLQKENLPPERVAEAINDIGRIISIAMHGYEELLREAARQCMT